MRAAMTYLWDGVRVAAIERETKSPRNWRILPKFCPIFFFNSDFFSPFKFIATLMFLARMFPPTVAPPVATCCQYVVSTECV